MEALVEVHRLISRVMDALAVKNENDEDASEMVEFCLAFREVVSLFPHMPADVKMKMMPLLRVLEKTLLQAEEWLLNYNRRKFTILGKEIRSVPGLRKFRKFWHARSWQSHMNRLHIKFQRVNSGLAMIAWTHQYIQSTQNRGVRQARTLIRKVSEMCDPQAQLVLQRRLSKSQSMVGSSIGIDTYSL